MRALLSRTAILVGFAIAVLAPVAFAASSSGEPACCHDGACCPPGCPFCHHAAK